MTSTMHIETGINRTELAEGSSTRNYLATSSVKNRSAMNVTCKAELNLYTISYQAIVLPSLLFNVLLFTAAILDRKKLTRQNYLFASVISTLLSNIVYIIMLEWVLIDNYFEVDVQLGLAGQITVAKYVWAFQEAITITLPFLVCGNIVCLAYVTVSSANYVGRTAHVEESEKTERKFLKIRRRTTFLIATSWMIPVVLTIIGTTWMNCVIDCICPSTNFEGDLCPDQESCSTFWAPVSKAYIWVNLGLWVIAIIGLFIYIGISIAKYQQKTRPSISKKPTADDKEISEFKGSTEPGTPELNEQSFQPKLQRKSRWPLRERLNSRLRFALVLASIYALSSASFVVAIILDSLHPQSSDFLIFALSRIAMYLYATASPVVMVWHLPALTTSLEKLRHRIRASCMRHHKTCYK